MRTGGRVLSIWPSTHFPWVRIIEVGANVLKVTSDEQANDDPLGLYADAGKAWAVVPVEARIDFAMYGYRLWPVQFENGQEEVFDLW